MKYNKFWKNGKYNKNTEFCCLSYKNIYAQNLDTAAIREINGIKYVKLNMLKVVWSNLPSE